MQYWDSQSNFLYSEHCFSDFFPRHLAGKTLTVNNWTVVVKVFAFGLIPQYKNNMKEVIDNRPSENFMFLRKVWKMVDEGTE